MTFRFLAFTLMTLVLLVCSGCWIGSDGTAIVLKNTSYLEGHHQGETVQVNMDESNKISGTLLGRRAKDLSFVIMNMNRKVLQRGSADAIEDSADEFEEGFEISIRNDLPSGRYILNLYLSSGEDIEEKNDDPWMHFKLRIKRKKVFLDHKEF